jgi:O-antigen ligase
MKNQLSDRFLGIWLGTGATATALLVNTVTNYDPVNAPKLLLLSFFAFGTLPFLVALRDRKVFSAAKAPLVLTSLFIFIFSLDLFFAKSHFTQAFYGVFGRNTGYLMYFSLALIFLSSALIQQIQTINLFIRAILIAGFANVVYCGIDILGPDLLTWSNPYGVILGTFGNPNFISAFLGIFITICSALVLNPGYKLYARIILALTAVIAFFEILTSNSIQGIVVTISGIAVVGFYWLRFRFKSNLATLAYSIVIVITGAFSLAGALQKGPLAEYIYKTSVSLRGVYWNAGLEMGQRHPFLGLGPDGYGDFYRTFRSAQSMIVPGPTTVTNSAHNIPIDMFAYGGYPLLIAYLLIVGFTLLSIVKVTLRTKEFNPIFVAIAAAWIGYQLQSIVSINQIGVAIWGWLFSGALVSFEFITRSAHKENVGSRQVKSAKLPKSDTGGIFFAVIPFALVGALMALPPVVNDIRFRNAIQNASLQQLIAASNSWPRDVFRMVTVANILENNKFHIEAKKLADLAVQTNPNSYDSWRILSLMTNASPGEKANAIAQMRRIDPRNVDLK